MKAEGMSATEIVKALKIGRASVYRALRGVPSFDFNTKCHYQC
jgi:hypothetical protein